MVHLSTEKVQDGLRVTWLAEAKPFPLEVSRTVLGITFPTLMEHTAFGYVCVAAERRWDEEKQFLIIDEAEAQNLFALTKEAIRLKDMYRAQTLYCPNSPPDDVNTLKRTEGLSFYKQESSIETRLRFPSYISKQTTCAVRDVKLGEMTHQGLETFLATELYHPESNMPILTKRRSVARKLVVVSDLQTNRARQGMQLGDPRICNALWLACDGLNKSGFVRRREDDGERTGSKATGY